MIPRMPRWQSYVATTTQPIFTPEQCKMIIDAGHQCAPEQAKVGGGEEESKRLGVPLLGQIPISEQIMLSTDKGEPLAMDESLNEIGQIYVDIANRILSTIN